MDEMDPNALYLKNKELQNKNLELAQGMSAMGLNSEDDTNLIQYQLETDKILERIEHFLKGHIVGFNEQGAFFEEPKKEILVKVVYHKQTKTEYLIQEKIGISNEAKVKSPERLVVRIITHHAKNDITEVEVARLDNIFLLRKIDSFKEKDKVNRGHRYIEVIDHDRKPFNDYGVAEFMRIISMYVTKETFLSKYSEERIMEILSDLADALNDFLYTNYEKMGMDTKFKESKYIMICLNIIHTIESCYRRAIGGAEQENIRTRAIVTQTGNVPSHGPVGSPMKQNWHPLKPGTW